MALGWMHDVFSCLGFWRAATSVRAWGNGCKLMYHTCLPFVVGAQMLRADGAWCVRAAASQLEPRDNKLTGFSHQLGTRNLDLVQFLSSPRAGITDSSTGGPLTSVAQAVFGSQGDLKWAVQAQQVCTGWPTLPQARCELCDWPWSSSSLHYPDFPLLLYAQCSSCFMTNWI